MTLNGFITGLISQVVQPVVQLMFSAAVVFFLWNVFKLIAKSDEQETRAEFKSRVIWGLVAIAAMASVWGLVSLILGSTGLNTGAIIDIRTGP